MALGDRMQIQKIIATYILASKRNGTLYTGSALDLMDRVWAHKQGSGSHFTRKYGVHRLVWFKTFEKVTDARAEEYRIKNWRRAWKINLIEQDNPNWDDLYLQLA